MSFERSYKNNKNRRKVGCQWEGEKVLINEKRLNKIGIDRIVLNNFKIINFESLEKQYIKNKDESIEKLEIKTDLF